MAPGSPNAEQSNVAASASFPDILRQLSHAPLGVGPAFPATVSMAVAFIILLKKYEHDFIWKLNQYKPLLSME